MCSGFTLLRFETTGHSPSYSTTTAPVLHSAELVISNRALVIDSYASLNSRKAISNFAFSCLVLVVSARHGIPAKSSSLGALNAPPLLWGIDVSANARFAGNAVSPASIRPAKPVKFAPLVVVTGG